MAYHVTQPDVDDALVSTMQRYMMRDQAEVKRILRRYPFLAPVLVPHDGSFSARSASC